MKILVVTPLYEPAWQQGGGVVTCLASLNEAMASGHSVTVYTTNAGGSPGYLDVPLAEPVVRNGVRVYYFKSTFGPRNAFDSRQLCRHLRATVSEFDAVYIVALWQWMGISVAHICMRAGVPFVIGTHGGFSTRLRTKSCIAKLFFRRVLLRTPLQRAAAVHLTARAEKADAGTWLNGLKCFVVPNAVDPTKYRCDLSSGAQFRKKHSIPESHHVVVCVGRPDWKKRVELLIGALKERKKCSLVFVGDDGSDMAPAWREYAEKIGVADRVIWTGFLRGDELLAALSAGDLFALVSENENFGMVVVEAMLCGLPVLISKEVGVHEYVQDQPFVTTSDISEAAVTEALRTIEPRLAALRADRERIRQCAIDLFAPARVAGSFVDELRKLLKVHPPAESAEDTESRAIRLERVRS